MKIKTVHFWALFALMVLPASGMAGTDEFLGDANIYTGMPGSMTRPNVLFIIDNSQSTDQIASGEPYLYYSSYPGDYVNNSVYLIDQQGDVAQGGPVINDFWTLDSVNCSNSGVFNRIPRDTLYYRGTYSGAGSDEFPNLSKASGQCDFDSPMGAVYALGNYLNYAATNVYSSECLDGATVVKACEWSNKNSDWDCSSPKYFRLTSTHTSTGLESKSIWYKNSSDAPYWVELYDSPEVIEAQENYAGLWTPSIPYTMPDCPDPVGSQTQREAIYNAIEDAVTASVGSVDFGAMVYSQTGGATLVRDIMDLSQNLHPLYFGDDLYIPLECDPNGTYADKDNAYCQFMWAIPGVINNTVTGAATVPGQTGRPQAEALFDGGYYFGAFDGSVNNELENNNLRLNRTKPCNVDHIILVTNGFTNGDNFQSVSVADVVGDFDGDNYPDENVYGLGSHWLDDVAKYLKDMHDITTHTVIAFQERDTLLQKTAKNGGGKFFQAYNAEQLSEALTKLLASIVNESSTSFVAPVVPASTTNRTISSNKVYLGLFRPQSTPPWRGNIKKYALGSNNSLLAADGEVATYPSGDFDPDSISYWSLVNGVVPTAAGDIDPNNLDPNKPNGDGGEVDAGGSGGVLLKRMEALQATIFADPSQWHEADWRNIYTVTGADGDLTAAANRFTLSNNIIDNALLGAEPDPGAPPAVATTDPAYTDWQARLDRYLEEQTAPWRDNMVRFINGFADNEAMDLSAPSSIEVRDWILGDVLHSRPVSINYSRYNGDADADVDLEGVQEVENVCPPDGDPIPDSQLYNTSVLFVGANDGMLHAFRDCDGKELWAFIPPNVLDSLKYIREPQSDGHPTFIDGAPSVFVHDFNNNGVIEAAGGDRVVLVVGQRRGGGVSPLDNGPRGAYFALDVTDYTSPRLLWTVDSQSEKRYDTSGAVHVTAGPAEMGEPWSQPRLAKLPVDGNTFKIVALVGAGYDNLEDLRYGQTQNYPDYSALTEIDINDSENLRGGTVDGAGDPMTSDGTVTAGNGLTLSDGTVVNPRGRGILAIEVATLTQQVVDEATGQTAYVATVEPSNTNTVGRIFWNYTRASDSNLTDLVYSFPSDLTVLDMDGNGYHDRIYIGDTGGNLWRFNLSGADTTAWSGEIIFRANQSGATDVGRKIFYRPQVAIVNGYPRLYFGTGDREHPLNTAVVDRMYSVIDYGQTTTMSIDETRLVDVTLNELQEGDAATASATLDQLYSTPALNVPLDDSANDELRYGWYIKMEGAHRGVATSLGEKVLAPATIFDGQVFFSTYQLLFGAQAGCEAGNLGISRLYHLDYLTGEAVYDYDTDNNGDTPQNERGTTEDGKVLARTDRVRTLGEGIPSGIVTIVDASGRVTMLISSSDKVEATNVTDTKLISPVYWINW